MAPAGMGRPQAAAAMIGSDLRVVVDCARRFAHAGIAGTPCSATTETPHFAFGARAYWGLLASAWAGATAGTGQRFAVWGAPALARRGIGSARDGGLVICSGPGWRKEGQMRLAIVAALLLAGCAGDMVNDNMRQTQNLLVLEPHPSGAPRLRAGVSGPIVGVDREAERMASLRYLTRGTCPAPRLTPEPSAPAGSNIAGPMDRKYWRVEC